MAVQILGNFQQNFSLLAACPGKHGAWAAILLLPSAQVAEVAHEQCQGYLGLDLAREDLQASQLTRRQHACRLR
jgi:hypothetical protein